MAIWSIIVGKLVRKILPSSPVELAIRWFVGARNTNVMASTVATMAVTKIPLSVTTVIAPILPCAGMAAPVSSQVDFVTGILSAAMALMSLTLTPSVSFAQKKAVCLVQDFLATAENFVMAKQLVLIIGTNYYSHVNPIQAVISPKMPILPSAVRRPASFSVETDPCASKVGSFAMVSKTA